MNKLILILGSVLIISGCGPSGPSVEQIEQAELRYNQRVMSNFDEEEALEKACWISKEKVWTEYKDGEILIKQENSQNANDSYLYQETCISDLKNQIDNLSVKDNEKILVTERPRIQTEKKDLILFSILNEPADGYVESTNTSDGCFRFLSIGEDIFNKGQIKIDGPNACIKWHDRVNNNAKFYTTQTVGVLEFDKPNRDITLSKWLNRESLVYHYEVGARYTNQDDVQYTFKTQYRLVDEETMKNVLKDILEERYKYLLTKTEEDKARKLNKKNKKQL